MGKDFESEVDKLSMLLRPATEDFIEFRRHGDGSPFDREKEIEFRKRLRKEFFKPSLEERRKSGEELSEIDKLNEVRSRHRRMEERRLAYDRKRWVEINSMPPHRKKHYQEELAQLHIVDEWLGDEYRHMLEDLNQAKILREKRLEHIHRKHKLRLELEAKEREDNKLMTKRDFRALRLMNIPYDYENWYDVVEEQGGSWEEVKRRMLENLDYDPFKFRDQVWYDYGNPKYALMDGEERLEEFKSAWFSVTGKHLRKLHGRNLTVFRKAVDMADARFALYEDWVKAQYWRYGSEILYTHLVSQYAEDIYCRWQDEGHPEPEPEEMVSPKSPRRRSGFDFNEKYQSVMSKGRAKVEKYLKDRGF